MNNLKNPLVSVIVPNYCHSKYLDQRFQSILNQTYQNFELIILDDKSPDNGASMAVIEKYRNNSHVSHIIYNEINSGSTFKQWHKGFDLAKGELIWIAESDDFCDSNLLESLVSEFKRDKDLVLAYCLSQDVDSDGNYINIFRRTPSGVTRLKGHDYIKRYMILANHCRNASACLFKKSVLSEIPKTYMTYKAGGDMLFWICFAEHGNVAIVNKKLNYFRQHNNKVTTKSDARGINKMEFHNTFLYLVNDVKISNWRKQLILWSVMDNIDSAKYVNPEIKRDLINLWGLKRLNILQYIVIKFVHGLNNRLSIYL